MAIVIVVACRGTTASIRLRKAPSASVLGNIAEARRYDRAGSGDWAIQVRQRYRYDAGNIRTLKETVDGQTADPSGNAIGGVERVALYVMPGDFERRGLVTNRITDTYDASLALGTETQYLVAGARVVWKPGGVAGGGTGFERDARVTLAMSNLLQSTAGVVDLVTGALLEVGTFYPNGARETLRANTDVEEFALEPVGFTGKEDDSEVGLVYFGMRYLMPHLGRWASPDPLQIHAGGGGEFGNSYHYVSGNLLQARDPLGLLADQPGRSASERTLAVLEAYRTTRYVMNVSLLDVVRTSNNIRPYQVEQLARQGRLRNDSRFRGALGEMVVADRIQRQLRLNGAGQWAAAGTSRHIQLQPSPHDFSMDFAVAIPRGCECLNDPSRLEGVIHAGNRRLDPSGRTYGSLVLRTGATLHFEVTTAVGFEHIYQRAVKVGTLQRWFTAKSTRTHSEKAFLAVDRAAWERLNAAQRNQVLDALTPVGAGLVVVNGLNGEVARRATEIESALSSGSSSAGTEGEKPSGAPGDEGSRAEMNVTSAESELASGGESE